MTQPVRTGVIDPVQLVVPLGGRIDATVSFGGVALPEDQLAWKIELYDTAFTPATYVDVTSAGPLTFGNASIEAPSRPTAPKFKVSARLSDPANGDIVATSTVRTRLGWPTPGGPAPVDDWSVPFVGESLPWNDWQGRRAWALILDALNQLPPALVTELGDIAIVRAKGIIAGVGGLHFPFGVRALLLSDELFTSLSNSRTTTPEDERIVLYFLHEMAHVIMCNRAYGDEDRLAKVWERLKKALKAQTKSPFDQVLDFFVSPFFSIFDGWIATPSHDFASEYAEAAHWVIRRIDNPNWVIATTRTQPPDVVTGSYLLGGWPVVNLRNYQLAESPTADPRARRQEAGFVTDYSMQDLHEDWAESFAYLALLDEKTFREETPAGFKDSEAFRSRREFFSKSDVWPEEQYPVLVGDWLRGWIATNTVTTTDMRDWWVDFGPYVRTTGGPATGGGALSSKVGAAAAEGDDQAGIGGGEQHPGREQAAERYRLAAAIEAQLQAFDQEQGGVLRAFDATMSALEIPARNASMIELLRTVALHGDGLRPAIMGGTAVAANAVGDLMIDDAPSGWLVTKSESGTPREIMAVAGESVELVPTKPRYFWTPSSEATAWRRRAVEDGIRDLPEAMLRAVRLWGEERDANGTLIGGLATLFTLLAEPWGLNTAPAVEEAWPLDAGERETLGYCHTHGDGFRSREVEIAPQPGDVMRFAAPDHWAVVVSQPDAPLLAAIGPGADAPGPIGEASFAAKLLHGAALGAPAMLWAPSGAPRRFVTDSTASTMLHDIDLAMRRAVRNVGLTHVTLPTGVVSAYADRTWLSLLQLMLDGSAKPQAAAIRDAFSPGNDPAGYQAEALMLCHGAPSAGAGVGPGNLIEWIAPGGARRAGMVLAADAGGAPTSVFAIDAAEHRFTVEDINIDASGVTFAWRPSTDMRHYALTPEIAGFYGDPSTLHGWLARIAEGGKMRLPIDCVTRECDPTWKLDAPAILAANAPDALRGLISTAGGNKPLSEQLGAFGAGIEPGAALATMPVGAWFETELGFGVVVQSSRGLAQRVALLDYTGLHFLPADDVEAQLCWRPNCLPASSV